MNQEQQEIAYQVARSVWSGHLTLQNAAHRIHKDLSINTSSAKYIVEAYICLRQGSVFKRALSLSDMSYFLQRIEEDEGINGLSIALDALRLHINYRERGGRSQPGCRKILEKEEFRLKNLIGAGNIKPTHLEELNHAFFHQVQKSLRDSAQNRLRRLASASKTPRYATRTIFVFERNPDVVAQVLVRAKGVCEGCAKEAPFFRKSDGTPYLEVHHIIPLAKNGDDSIENAIALCPNCHRERHYGYVEA